MNKRLVLMCVLLGLTVNCSNAFEPNVVNDNYGTPTYVFDIFSKGEVLKADDDKKVSFFEIPKSYTNALYISARDWADVLDASPKKLIEYYVLADNDYNAGALSLPVDVKGKDYKITWINAAFHNKRPIHEKEIKKELPSMGLILLGLGVSKEHPGWQPFSGKHSLYHDELPELNTVLEHEIMHSLGLTSYAQQFKEDDGDKTYYFSQNKKDNISLFDFNLRIYEGDMKQTFDSTKEIVPKAGMPVGKNKTFDIYKYSPYFVGKNTIKVLAGKDNYNDAKKAIINNGGLTNYSAAYDTKGKYPNVYGLPIHPVDDLSDSEIELSHIELRNSFMSHQDYRNWLIPMEAELALLNDIGYNIDIRKYFGRSYYLNNITDTYTAGYSEWNGSSYTGLPSIIDQGVGIHIYGNNNNITQASDILTKGEGSFGVRVDGVNNTYTLKSGSKIKADGKENIGIGVTWGKNHTINAEKNSTVTANGEDGIAASFDFGSNIFGIYTQQKGSYFKYEDSLGISVTPSEEHNDALVNDFNVEGTLKGKKAAIYISDNAHVKNINIKKGAKIEGDIVSEWNSVSSGYKSKIQRKNDAGEWINVNPKNEDEIYYTNLNFEKDYTGTVNGKITGDNEVYNTLKLNNKGKLTVAGDEIIVNTIDNTGAINLNNTKKAVKLETQTGEITGKGNLNIKKNVTANVDASFIENTVNLDKNGTLSTINDEKNSLIISKLNSNKGKLSFDLGDKILLHKDSDATKDKAEIGQIKVDEKTLEGFDERYSQQLFVNSAVTMNLGKSKANVYYDNEKFSIFQDPNDSSRLIVKKTGTGIELGDAAEDSTAANYIVTEKKLTKDAGTVNGDSFEISGNTINVNGNKGLVVDGDKNKIETILKTSIKGASDSNITVQNGGNLHIDAENKRIQIGGKKEQAISMNGGSIVMDALKNPIDVNGTIKGTNPKKDVVIIGGKNVTLNGIENVKLGAQVADLKLKGAAVNSDIFLKNTVLNVKKDAYLASDGTNKLTADKAIINLKNNKATEIPLSKMELKSDIYTNIDVDLKELKSDRFVFKKSDDLVSNAFSVNITDINVINSDAVLSEKKYEIPFASKDYHSENIAGNVNGTLKKEIMTPIIKYQMKYENNKDMSGFVLTRGSTSDYSNYNPSIFVAPVAAQFGGYLTQLNSYDQAFNNLDMKMLMTREERQAYKYANLYASEARPLKYSPVYLPEKDKAGWFRPYTAFDKVQLKRGPKVRNIMYGSFFGYDTDMFESASGWDSQYSVYFGYNGSHQKYQGNSIYQNGGSMGLSGIWYKGDFFTGLTANIGASVADASTMYGSEDFPMLMTGIASKTGYNWELAKGKFIIQPSYLMSYSFVNTFDYTNAAGARISSDPLHAINITPGIKLIGNIKNGWQPYAGVQMVWNIMDKTDFKAQNVDLPDMSVKPYVQYGIGVQKRWGDRFTGFFETNIRNAGRNGIAFNAGFRWALGK